jgi:hypothetical protein
MSITQRRMPNIKHRKIDIEAGANDPARPARLFRRPQLLWFPVPQTCPERIPEFLVRVLPRGAEPLFEK